MASQIFVSVTDEDERRQHELILRELHFLVQRAKRSTVEKVMSLTTPAAAVVEEEDDEAGTGEQESSEVTEEKKLRVRYALWVHDGVATQEQSEAHWKKFTEMPVIDLNPPKPVKK